MINGTSFTDMNDNKQSRASLIGHAIGAAVIQLTAKGGAIRKDNILYELELMAALSDDLKMK
ncbi:hypothetical protein PRCB_18390 [Pantoea rodasii]|uniref:Uncharacterized protein n=2 Tax=Pantoea rodasii TaxID=1076549 RepID=A0A2M9W9N8_9GAMM|nr:hypothetical protein HA45_12445 [Pantoea rodasii]PJZ04232.1 hypothetical protein PRCB_18390 [Pantoea rodasii]